MAKHRRNPWPKASKAHRDAALIGWGYRRDRKKKPAKAMRYLSAAGLSRAALKKYRKARKTKSSILLAKREKRKRKTGAPRQPYVRRPFLVNRARRNRRPNWYADFVKEFAHSHPGMKGPQLMRAASRAYRSGRGTSRRNPGVAPGSVYFNQMLPTVRPLQNRRRKKARRNIYTSFGNKRRKRNRKGQFVRKNRGRKRGYRRNPVLPYFAFENPVLPYAAFNPAIAATADPLAAVQEAAELVVSSDFWLGTVLPMGAGFVGAQFVGGFVQAGVEKIVGPQTGFLGSLQRIGSRALGGVGVSAVAVLATRDADLATKVLAGGLVSVFVQIIQELFGIDTYEKITGMAGMVSGIGADITADLKSKIARSVKQQIAAAEQGQAGIGAVNAFVSTQNLQTAPDLGPGPRVGGVGDFVQTQGLRTAPVESGQPMVADMSAYSNEQMDALLI